MNRGAMLGLALCAAGCTMEAQVEDEELEDEEYGELADGLLSFDEPIKFSKVYESRQKFAVAANGAVTVMAHAHWDRPAACRAPSYTIELVKKGLMVNSPQGARPFPTSRSTHSETWSGLGAGTYFLVLATPRSDPTCTLIGAMSVMVKP